MSAFFVSGLTVEQCGTILNVTTNNEVSTVSNEKEHHTLININRLLIYGFGLMGLFFDYKWAYFISMTMWVWLPYCIQFELRIAKRMKVNEK